MSCADLEEINVCVHHGVAEVALDVRHGLALDLQPVAHPFSSKDLVKGHLIQHRQMILLGHHLISFALGIKSMFYLARQWK